MLQLRLLGALEVLRDGRPMPLPPSKRTRALLAYLAVSGRRHSRARLCELLWGLPDDPRGALRWSLSKLRPIVDEPDRRRIRADRDFVALDAEGADVDVLAVRDLNATGFGRLPTMTLEELAARFAGDFLEGLDLPEQHPFAAWCIAQRDDAVGLHIALRRLLIGRYDDCVEAGLRHARTLCRIDALSEFSHAALCRLLRSAGRVDEAERQRAASIRFLTERGIALTGALDRNREPSIAAVRAQSETAAPAPPVNADIESTTNRKPATALFAAFPGFFAGATAATDDPEVVLARVDAFMQRALPHIGAFRGEVISAQSDGILAIFGAPLADEDHAARACQAALDIVSAVAGHGDAGLRIGVATGEVIVRPGSGAQPWEAVGGIVELAPRIAAAAEIGAVAVTEAVFKQIEGLFAAEPFLLSGQRFYRVTSTSYSSTRWRARAFRSLARFQGRRKERVLFEQALDQARLGHGAIVAIIGEAGIGKSRLVAENLVRAQAQAGWKTFEIGTSPRETPIMFEPLRALLHAWLGTSADTLPCTIEERLQGRLSALGPGYTGYAAALSALLGLAVDNPGWLRLGVEQRRQNTVDALVALILRECDDSPVIVIFEDLHWIDAAGAEFLALLASAIARRRLVLMITFRPEYNVPWANRQNYIPCRLDALSDDEERALLDDALGTHPTLKQIKTKLIDHCEGNPLFLEECIRALIETEVLTGRAGALVAAKPLANVSTPASVAGILTARIDRLTPRQRLVLQASAVVGKTFSSEILAGVTECPLNHVREALTELEAAEFIALARLTPVLEYRFLHALTQHVTYGALLQARRTVLRRAVGMALLRQADDQIAERSDVVADHLDVGEVWEEAGLYGLRAAAPSEQQYAYEIALDHAACAVACS